MVEIILKFTPPRHREARLFNLLQSTLTNREQGVDIHFLMLYYLIWVLRIEGMMFKSTLCYNCSEREFKTAWIKTNFRGILCPQCRTDEKIRLEALELNFIAWTETHNPRDLSRWAEKLDPAGMIRLFVRKIEHHGEIVLKSTQYLPEFR